MKLVKSQIRYKGALSPDINIAKIVINKKNINK